jgi:hypothetical protein
MAASAQPTILRGLSALPPSPPPSHRVGISGPQPNNAIKPALSGDFPAQYFQIRLDPYHRATSLAGPQSLDRTQLRDGELSERLWPRKSLGLRTKSLKWIEL